MLKHLNYITTLPLSCFILAMALPKVSMLLLLLLLSLYHHPTPILLYISDGTAEGINVVVVVVVVIISPPYPAAPNDYTGTIEIITFTQDEVQPIRISILNDNLVEDTEFFSAHLTTTQDNLIRLGDATASISILDNDSKSGSIY